MRKKIPQELVQVTTRSVNRVPTKIPRAIWTVVRFCRIISPASSLPTTSWNSEASLISNSSRSSCLPQPSQPLFWSNPSPSKFVRSTFFLARGDSYCSSISPSEYSFLDLPFWIIVSIVYYPYPPHVPVR
jgi:hypothetical protein